MEKTEKSNLFNKDERCGLKSKMGTRLHCDECNKIVRITMMSYCDMDICQECYLQNLKHEHWNILHRLAVIQSSVE